MFGVNIFYSTNKYCYAEKNTSHIGLIQVKCPGCGRIICQEDVLEDENALLISGGREYPDFMLYGSVGLSFIVSDLTMTLIQKYKITGYDNAEKVPIYRSRYGKLVKQDVIYYMINITGNIDLDLKAMSLKRKNKCTLCEGFDWNRQRLGIVDSVIDMSSWDGSDLCRIKSFPGHIVVSNKFKDIVEQYRLTGIIFKSENAIFKL